METGIFRGYYRIIYISFSVVFLTAVFLAYNQFDSRLDYEKTLIHKEFQQGISELNRTAEACYHDLQSMRTVIESYNNTSSLQKPHPYFQYIQNNLKDDYFHLDSLPNDAKKAEVGNVTGFGKIEDLTQERKNLLSASLFLNPLFNNLKKEVPNVALVYYLSTYKDFMLLYPFIPSNEFRLKKSTALRMDSVYANVFPDKNPNRKQVWTSAYIDAIGLGMMVSSALPIYKGDKNVGVLAIDLTLDSLKSIIQRSQRKYGEIFVVNEYNQLLAHPTLASSADKTLKTLSEALPDNIRKEIQDFTKIPEKKLYRIGNYYVYYENVPELIGEWSM